MKVICTQENLKNGLMLVGRVVSPTNTLPILNNILLKTENGLLKISSTNLEIAINTSIRCKVEEEGGVTVFSKTIIDLVNSFPNKNITLETKDINLDMEAENYHTNIKTLPVEEFPLIPEPEGDFKLEINAQVLKAAVNQVTFAASTNQTQPEISGILLKIEGKELTLVATDRYRLAEKKVLLNQDSKANKQVIVPQKTIFEISRIIGQYDGSVELVLSDNQIACVVESTQIISRLIDGQYPDYKAIIPENFNTTIKAPKQQLVSALKAVSVFSQNNNSIELHFSKEKQFLSVAAESPDLGKSVVDVPSEVDGSSGELILNHKYILDCLSAIDTDQVVVKIINDSSPSLLLPENKNDYTYLVMPIKV